MLQSLYIKNFTLIDEINIDFTSGLNIVLGETGAGKSIVIDALMTTLGERTSPELVKSGESKSIVEATFFVENPEIINSILKDPDNLVQETICLRREVTSKGTSRCFLNDTPYPLNLIKEIGEYLVDFHGQHTHQQLLSPKFQLELLDSISRNEELLQVYKQYRKVLEENIKILHNLEKELELAHREREKIEYDLQELLRINPQPNELEEIEKELKKLENIEIINTNLNEAYEILYKSESSVVDSIAKAIKKLENILKFEPALDNFVKQLENTIEIISDISVEIQKKFIETDFDPEHLDNLRTRLSELKYLEKKYLTYNNIFTEKDRLQGLVLKIYSLEEEIKKVKERIQNTKAKLKSIALEISDARKQAIKILEKKVPEILSKLGMKNTVFNVNITQEFLDPYDTKDFSIDVNGKAIKLLQNGIDRVEFLIATSANTKPMPLENIVSGGELSRLMLALKSIAAEHYKSPTMIFDEIDVGISGKIASMTAQLMKTIAKTHQIIAITHLPQIAAAGNNTILIEKKEEAGKLKIIAKQLDNDAQVVEIARLLSGEKISDFAIENAKKLIAEMSSE